MLPKKMSFFWGNDTLSWLRYVSIQSFVKLNPSWDVTLYSANCTCNVAPWKTREHQDFFGSIASKNYLDKLDVKIVKCELPFKSARYANINSVHASDLFRWYLLSTESGFYSDTDILWIRPIDEIYEDVKHANYITSHSLYVIMFLGSSGANELTSTIYTQALVSYNPTAYQSCGTKLLRKIFSSCKYKDPQLKMAALYPGISLKIVSPAAIVLVRTDKLRFCFEENLHLADMPKEAIGIHWCGGYSDSQRWNGILTEDNFLSQKLTVTNLVRELNVCT